MINIYIVEIKTDVNFKEEDIKKCISRERQKRADILVNDETKRNFLFAEIFTFKKLENVYNIKSPIILGNQGEKTRLYDHSDVSLSRSYSKNMLSLAIDTENEIGIDCEQIKNFDKNTLKYFFTEGEIDFINRSKNPSLSYYMLWTRKESIIKCTGVGLVENLRCLDTLPCLEDIQNYESIGACDNVDTKEKVNIKSIRPLFNRNYEVNGLYINSYIYDDLVISVCVNNDVVLPNIIVENNL